MHNTFSVWIFSAWMFFSTLLFSNAASVHLAWDPPVTNMDGTIITNKLGYKLYYGHYSSNYIHTLDVGSQTNYAIMNLDTSDNYFAVTAYDIVEPVYESPYSIELFWESSLPVYPYSYFRGSEFTLSTNQVLLSWTSVSNATTYNIYGVWNDTQSPSTYNYGDSQKNYLYVPMSRSGHFYYYIKSFNGTNLIKTIRSDIDTSGFYVHGYTNQTPWKIYWKLPAPTGIIID